MSRGIVRRAPSNTQPVVRVLADQSLVDAAASAHSTRTDNPHAVTARQAGAYPAFRSLALVSCHVGISRAFLYDAWRWHPPTVGSVLLRASLRG
jgi:hypothetical protein